MLATGLFLIYGIVSLASAENASAASSRLFTQLRNDKIIDNSYPRQSLKRGEEGIAGFNVETDTDGKLIGCVITQSTGHSALDKATCDLLIEHARFKPARDGEGRAIRAVRAGTLVWTLPDSAGTPEMADADPAEATAEVPDQVTCKYQLKTGSTFIKRKICLTKADWSRSSEYAREEVLRMQGPGGSSTQ